MRSTHFSISKDDVLIQQDEISCPFVSIISSQIIFDEKCNVVHGAGTNNLGYLRVHFECWKKDPRIPFAQDLDVLTCEFHTSGIDKVA
jgi:hypothetical protein